MVMGRGAGAGCWARTTGTSTRTERKIASRDTSLIREDSSVLFMNAWSKWRSLSQPLRIDGAEEETGSSAEQAGEMTGERCRSAIGSGEENFIRMHFLVACRSESCILRMRSRFAAAPRARIV